MTTYSKPNGQIVVNTIFQVYSIIAIVLPNTSEKLQH
jgi:hypothetical protein